MSEDVILALINLGSTALLAIVIVYYGWRTIDKLTNGDDEDDNTP